MKVNFMMNIQLPDPAAKYRPSPFWSWNADLKPEELRRQIRLMRRVVRDVRKRSAPAEFTLRLWNSVAANEEKSIFPYEHTADVRIDSFLSYEVFVLRDPLLSILKTVPQDSQAYQTAKELIEKLEPLPSLPESVVPKQSMYWEFL
jgi:uridine kinase